MAGAADRVWVDTMPAAYDRWLVPAVFRPFALDLARRAAVHAPARVLELAAGTGVLTREMVGIGASVTATDLNDAMVDLGRRRVPEARWRQADALHLPFAEGQFDLVACQFGVMFLPDRPAAFAEAARVLAPGGRVLVNTWATLDTHVFQAALVRALERVFPDDPPTFMAAVPHGYPDPDALAADVTAGGLRRRGRRDGDARRPRRVGGGPRGGLLHRHAAAGRDRRPRRPRRGGRGGRAGAHGAPRRRSGHRCHDRPRRRGLPARQSVGGGGMRPKRSFPMNALPSADAGRAADRVFALFYWELDRGGPAARAAARQDRPDFL